MAVIAFPSDGLSARDLKLVTDEGLRHGWRAKELFDYTGAVAAALISKEVLWHATAACWYVTRERGRYAVHSEYGDLIADGIILKNVLELAFLPARRMPGSLGTLTIP